MDSKEAQEILENLGNKIEEHGETSTPESNVCHLAVSFIRSHAMEWEAWHYMPEPPEEDAVPLLSDPVGDMIDTAHEIVKDQELGL